MPKRRLSKLITLLIFFYSFSLFSQVENTKANSSSKLTLEACINVALHNYPDVRTIIEEEEISRANYKIAQSANRPQVAAAANTYEIDKDDESEDDLTVPLQDTDFGLRVGFTARYDIWKPGRRQSIFNARKMIEAGKLSNLNKYNGIVLNVKRMYYSYLRSTRHLDLKKSTLDKYNIIYRRLQIESMAGQVGPVKLSSWEINRSTAQLQYDTAVYEEQLSRSNLFRAMGIEDSGLIIEQSLVEKLPQLKHEQDELVNLALENSPQILASKINEEVARSRVSAAKAQREPTFTGTALLGYENDYLTSNNEYIGKSSKWNPSFGVTFSASVPLYSGGYIPNNIKKEKANYAKTKNSNKQTLLDLKKDVRDAYNRMKFLEDQVKISTARIMNANTNLRIIERSFESGLAGQDEILEATEAQYEAEITLINNKIDYMLSLSSLANLLGVDEEYLCK